MNFYGIFFRTFTYASVGHLKVGNSLESFRLDIYSSVCYFKQFFTSTEKLVIPSWCNIKTPQNF